MTLARSEKVAIGAVGTIFVASALAVVLNTPSGDLQQALCDERVKSHKADMSQMSEESKKIVQPRKLLSIEYAQSRHMDVAVITVTKCEIVNGNAKLSRETFPGSSKEAPSELFPGS